MKIITLVAATLLGLLAFSVGATFAQQRPPTQAEVSGMVEALTMQVETTRNLHIQAMARAAVLVEENGKLKAELEELKKANGGSNAKQE